MSRLINYIADNFVVGNLDMEQAQEALFYLDILLEQSGECENSMKLLNLKTNILQRLVLLNTGQGDEKEF